MQIQWFPGHMHKARTQMAETLPKVDVVIELLDARIPFSSENPMLAELRKDKPCLKVLHKSDLADPALTSEWREYLERERGVKARAVTSKEPAQIRQLRDVCVQMFPHKQDVGKHVTAMIVGVPNVGKSTLINILAGRSVAKTGDEPAITKGQQRIRIGRGVLLLDTPGVLWPKVENPASGFRLATVGSVRDTAMEYEDVAYFAAAFVLKAHPQRLVDRYGFDPLPQEPTEVLELIGKQRGCLNKRGIIDYERAARIFLHELRGGKLGRLTLETPQMMEQEKAELAILQAEQAERKLQHDQQRKANFKARQRENRGG